MNGSILKMKGKVYSKCAYALLIGDALERIRKAGIEEIIATNSIPEKCIKATCLRFYLQPSKIIHP